MLSDPEEMRRRLAELRLEHRNLDHEIRILSLEPYPDQLRLTRMKKQKLRLKEAIAWLEDALIPDMPA